MKNNKPQKSETSNSDRVEFGIEFGDLNASKLYEIPFVNQDKEKKDKKDC